MKEQWTLSQHRLCSTTGDNVHNLVRVSLIAGIMEGYDFDVARFISREIQDQVVGTDVILAVPCLLT